MRRWLRVINSVAEGGHHDLFDGTIICRLSLYMNTSASLLGSPQLLSLSSNYLKYNQPQKCESCFWSTYLRMYVSPTRSPLISTPTSSPPPPHINSRALWSVKLLAITATNLQLSCEMVVRNKIVGTWQSERHRSLVWMLSWVIVFSL
jgi:hypothetical protein